MWPQMSPEACVFSSGRKVGQKFGCDGASAKMPSGALALTWRPWHEFVTQGSTYLLVSKDRRLPANCPPFAFVPLLRSRNDCSAAQRWQSAEVARERESMCRCWEVRGPAGGRAVHTRTGVCMICWGGQVAWDIEDDGGHSRQRCWVLDECWRTVIEMSYLLLPLSFLPSVRALARAGQWASERACLNSRLHAAAPSVSI